MEAKDIPPSPRQREAVCLWQSVLDLVNTAQHVEDYSERQVASDVARWCRTEATTTRNERRAQLFETIADELVRGLSGGTRS